MIMVVMRVRRWVREAGIQSIGLGGLFSSSVRLQNFNYVRVVSVFGIP
jgi:hypothetical protein